jgi:hypothetical protein
MLYQSFEWVRHVASRPLLRELGRLQGQHPGLGAFRNTEAGEHPHKRENR